MNGTTNSPPHNKALKPCRFMNCTVSSTIYLPNMRYKKFLFLLLLAFSGFCIFLAPHLLVFMLVLMGVTALLYISLDTIQEIPFLNSFYNSEDKWKKRIPFSEQFRTESKAVFKTILVTITIIIVAGFAAYFFTINGLRTRRTEKKLHEIASALYNFKTQHNQFPTTLQPLIQANPLRANWVTDAWNHPIQYTLKGTSFDLRSPGKDGALFNNDDIVTH